jgi:hypothetical protein
MPPITAAVIALANRVKIVNGLDHHAACRSKRLNYVIALDIDVTRNVMRDLPRRMAETDPLVKCRGSRP